MRLIIKNHDYDIGVHPGVTEIRFKLWVYTTTFFEEDRFPDLKRINCSHSALRSLVVRSSSLETLKCRDGCLNYLEVDCPNLRELDVTSNFLDKLVLKSSSLVSLYCSNNRLKHLKLDSTILKVLFCSGNRLKEITLSCPSLSRLECVRNQLKILELELPSLEVLGVSENPLENLCGLEFSHQLKHLWCPASIEKLVMNIRDHHLPDLNILIL